MRKPQTRARRFAAVTLKEILNFYPISEAQAFAIAQVHKTTWNRWKSGQANPPPAIVALIEMYALGSLPDPAFTGFYVRDGILYDPAGYAYTPHDLRSIAILKQHSARYLGMLRAQDAERARTVARPDPLPGLKLVK